MAIITDSNIIIAFCDAIHEKVLAENFAGTIFLDVDSDQHIECTSKTIYLCGDISKASNGQVKNSIDKANRVFIIRDLSYNVDIGSKDWNIIGIGRVPILIHEAGVLYRHFFDSVPDYFDSINREHNFQSLTESDKTGKAYRTGIYLTPVEQDINGDIHFRLLRCSTNLSGPTDNFRACDIHIVNSLNHEASNLFDEMAPLNHVLAQIYWNTKATPTEKMKKARISAHSDKTKDMPENGIIAFCTFYSQLEDKLTRSLKDRFDWVYSGKSGSKCKTSGLTKLHFRLKKVSSQKPGCQLREEFSVTLYPNSVFLIPLSTNRFYTHEIRPPSLQAEQIPTRLGYVVRCSKTEAIHMGNQTFIKKENINGDIELIPMVGRTLEGVQDLRLKYAEENSLDTFIDYGNRFIFSMNDGDYIKPIYNPEDEFRCYYLPSGEFFDELFNSAKFDNIVNGRQGAVLVKPDIIRGFPIVRTTTKYPNASQHFKDIHVKLAGKIKEVASLNYDLNNCLIEVYNSQYTKMGFHSDQAQDLQIGSHIAVFSCYKDPTFISRKLVIKSKETGYTFEIKMKNNSVIVWSLNTNRRFKHKIVTDNSSGCHTENDWLGITFRTSRTFIRFSAGNNREICPSFSGTSTPFSLADVEQQHQFYKFRGRENSETDFVWPSLDFTISDGDLKPPT